MSIIKLNAQNCQNCYKCIRECPLKAISFKDSRATIMENECVLCGGCIETCPQSAKYVKSNTAVVKNLIASGKPVCVSIAPSFSGWYKDKSFKALAAALSKLGFARVEETAIGAAQISHEYAELMEEGQMKTIIATACSSIVMLIERHFPALVKQLAPVASPMMAHARLMREAYGDIKVVFIGPCLSKMEEAQDPLAGGLVNEVLTFADLDRWLSDENITISEEDNEVFGVASPMARLYPKPLGILQTLEGRMNGYTPISIDGIERCMELFSRLQKEPPAQNIFIEANLCPGSCVGGPIMRQHDIGLLSSLLKIKGDIQEIDARPAPCASMQLPHPRVFANRSTVTATPTPEQISAVLAKIGKVTKEQELNCGSCGYATCREKAVAVLQGKADVNMCLPYLRDKAESMSSTVIENSPNGIITFDENQLVTELNPKAERLFGVERATVLGELIPALYGETAFDEAKETKKAVEKKCEGSSEDIHVELTVIYLPKNNSYVAFAKDISNEETNKKELERMRLSTLDVAQNVIDKQMRVAQEIASLLGETTAETKVALTRLKKSMKSL